MEAEIQNYFCQWPKDFEVLHNNGGIETEQIIETKQQFVEKLAESYIKLAYLFIEEIDKPISLMKKMIRKPLKSKGKIRKHRLTSISTQNTDEDILQYLKCSISTRINRN